MIALSAGLAAGLGLALLAVVLLALSRRRLVRLLVVEQAKSRARELAAKVALQERLAADVAVLVAPLRSLLEDQARARAASAADVAQLVASFRGLVEWFAAFAGAHYEQACASAGIAQETVRKPQRAAPSIAPPGSADVLPPGPAQVAAGLGPRPSSRPLSVRETPHPPPVRVGAASRATTLIGVASPLPLPARAVSPTLPSMSAPKANDGTGGDA